MNKKLIAISVAAIIVIAAVVTLLVRKPWSTDENNSAPTAPSTSEAMVTDDSAADEPAKQETSEQAPEPAAPATPVGYYGEMIANGNQIIGSKTNQHMRVTGMSFFWSNWSQKYYTKEYVDLMVDDFQCEVVRCSYGIQDNGVPHDPSCVPLIYDVIEQAIERGVYVLVDWHAHGAHNNPDEAVAFFTELAQKYGQYDNLVFEIYNEPMNVGWAQIKEYAEIVIPEIRKYSDNLIIVGTPNWSQDVVAAANDPVVGDNIAYALHFYAGTHTQWLRDNGTKALNAGIPLFVTEWGSVNADGNGRPNEQSTAEWFAWIDANGLSSCNWAINDKDEGSSVFSSDAQISDTGIYIRGLIQERTANSPWRG